MTGDSTQGESPSQGEGATIARRAGVVVGFTFLSRVAGYVRDATMGNIFGAGPAFDAFVAAQTIPYILRRLVAEGALMIAFVPLLGAEKRAGGVPAMRRFYSAVLGALVPILLGIVGLAMAFPEIPVAIVAGGFDAETADLAAGMTRIMMPFLLFVSLTAVASGALNVQGVFGPPAAAPILLNLVMIISAYVGIEFFSVPITAVAWGLMLGGVAQLLLQLPFLGRVGLLVGPRWDPSHPGLQTLLKRMLPAVFGVAVYQLNIVVIRRIASALPQGQMSCYFYATRLEEFALGVFAVSISIAALPTLSDHAARGDRRALMATYRRALRATNFITVPSAVGLYVLAEPIVGVLFRHGRFTAEAGLLTADLLRIMACALIPIGLVRVTVPTYYAIGDTKTPVVAATASLFTTAALGLWLQGPLEIVGLTLATLAGALAQVVVLGARLGVGLHNKFGVASSGADRQGGPDAPTASEDAKGAAANEPSVVAHALRCLIAIAPSAALVAVGAQQREWMNGDNLTGAAVLAVFVGLAAVGYAAVGRGLRLAEVDLVWGMIRRRMRR